MEERNYQHTEVEPVFEQHAQATETPTDLCEVTQLQRFKHGLSHCLFTAITGSAMDKKSVTKLMKKQKEALGYKGTPMPNRQLIRTAKVTPKEGLDTTALMDAFGKTHVQYINRNGVLAHTAIEGNLFKDLLNDTTSNAKKLRDMARSILAFDRIQKLNALGLTSKDIAHTTVADTLALDDIISHRSIEAFGLKASSLVRHVEVNPADLVRQGFTSLRLHEANGDYDPITSIYQHGVKVHTYGPSKHLDNGVLGYNHLSVNVDTLTDITVSPKQMYCSKAQGGCGKALGLQQVAKGGLNGSNTCPSCGNPKHMMSIQSADIALPQLLTGGRLKTHGGHQVHMTSCRINKKQAEAIMAVKRGVLSAEAALNLLIEGGVRVNCAQIRKKAPAKVVVVAFDVAYNGITFGLAVERIETIDRYLPSDA
jgi:hypothetical protein